MTDLVKRITYSAVKSGKHLVVLGAVHGNEKCGTEGIFQMAADIDSGKITIDAGTLTLVPIANPGAYEKGVRFLERNLNRYLYPKDEPKAYEDFLDPIICGILDEADALLDIHSYQSFGKTFGFLGTSSQEELDFCRSLGVKDFVYGWSDAFGNSGENEFESMGTSEYTRYKGGIATTIECGHHNNPDNAEIAYNIIKNAMSYLGISSQELDTQEVNEGRCVKMKSVFYKEKEGKLAKEWRHYDAVKKGDVLAVYDDGEELLAPEDGHIVLPKSNMETLVGAEWFNFGIATEFPAPDKQKVTQSASQSSRAESSYKLRER